MGMRWALLFFGLVCAVSWSYAAEPEKIGPAWVWSMEGRFADAKTFLVAAIEARGMVISYVSHAQTMLDRTSEAVGAAKAVYADAEIILFCKADLSYDLVVANPHNIALCPYAISIYTLAGDPERVYLSIREPYGGEPTYQPIVELLTGIIHEVLGE